VYVPGEIEHRLRADRLRRGIPLAEGVVAELGRFAAELGVEPLVAMEERAGQT
jgi:LDH2 family malate/lactate/ureidoglycolate dehydrogenase